MNDRKQLRICKPYLLILKQPIISSTEIILEISGSATNFQEINEINDTFINDFKYQVLIQSLNRQRNSQSAILHNLVEQKGDKGITCTCRGACRKAV